MIVNTFKNSCKLIVKERKMKIHVCIRCKARRVGILKLTEKNIQSVNDLVEAVVLKVDYQNEVCHYCRSGIGDEISNTLLKMFGDEKLC